MALVLIKEDGTGKSDANSYADVADGDAYHDAHLYATAWTAATTGNKEKALAMATRVLDAEYKFYGVRTKETQALQWPRDLCPDRDCAPDPDGCAYLANEKVPVPLVSATCEMARELLILDRTAPPPGEGVASTWTDVSGTRYSKSDKRPVVSLTAQALLVKYGFLWKRGEGRARLVRV